MSGGAHPEEIKLRSYEKGNCGEEKEATERCVKDHARFKTNERELLDVGQEIEEQYMLGRGERCEETRTRRKEKRQGRLYQGGA
jgi:hypothetical protein